MSDLGSSTPPGSSQNNRKKGKKPTETRKPWGAVFWIVLLLVLFLILNLGNSDPMGKKPGPTLLTLRKDLMADHVSRVQITSEQVTWEMKDGAPKGEKHKVAKIINGIPDDLRNLIEEKVPSGLEEILPSFWTQVLLSWAPWLFLIFLFYFFFFRQMRSAGGGGIFSFGKSRATLIQAENINKTFKDVAGVEEAKEELAEIVEFLKDPEKFTRLGGRLPRGVLLNGPPGTGKTLLAKAIAGEAGVPFYSISGSDFVEMFVGVGASRVRDLFSQAKENSPSIIFLDEIDAVGRKRGSGLGGGHDEREQTLNAILVEMDGFGSDEGVIVIASTNRIDVLDPALLRPGRFDRHVSVGLPDIEGRKAILKVHGEKIKLSEEARLDVVAQGTPGFSGADLENLLNEAALIAVADDKEVVGTEDIEAARDKVAFGKEKKNQAIHKDDLKNTAYHECGHALVSLKIDEPKHPLHKLTIIPRGNALGAAFYLPERDMLNHTRKFIIGQIMVCYGGRIAEEVFFGDVTNGAMSDIQQATGYARKMVTEWGMSEKLGLLNYTAGEERMFLGGEITKSKSYSEETAKAIDAEVKAITTDCYNKAKEIIVNNKDIVEKMAEKLLVYETLSGEEVQAIVDGKEISRQPPVKTVIKRIDDNGNDISVNNGAASDKEETSEAKPVEENQEVASVSNNDANESSSGESETSTPVNPTT